MPPSHHSSKRIVLCRLSSELHSISGHCDLHPHSEDAPQHGVNPRKHTVIVFLHRKRGKAEEIDKDFASIQNLTRLNSKRRSVRLRRKHQILLCKITFRAAAMLLFYSLREKLKFQIVIMSHRISGP